MRGGVFALLLGLDMVLIVIAQGIWGTHFAWGILGGAIAGVLLSAWHGPSGAGRRPATSP
jgi:hypothetical protein